MKRTVGLVALILGPATRSETTSSLAYLQVIGVGSRRDTQTVARGWWDHASHGRAREPRPHVYCMPRSFFLAPVTSCSSVKRSEAIIAWTVCAGANIQDSDLPTWLSNWIVASDFDFDFDALFQPLCRRRCQGGDCTPTMFPIVGSSVLALWEKAWYYSEDESQDGGWGWGMGCHNGPDALKPDL